MKLDNIQKFTTNYINSENNNRAIMLTAPWGSGKTFYIKNTLIPFLINENIRCAYISLYGLKNIFDISKNIFWELKYEKINKNSKTFKIGSTILKGVLSNYVMNLESINKACLGIYESLDLKNTLLIFDDLERTTIDFKILFGYINNLCENDKAKILIICSENDLNKIIENNDEIYKLIKEKTIGDTIKFHQDIVEQINNIKSTFNNKNLSKILNDNALIEEINNDILEQEKIDNFNLRSFIYCCEKFSDIFTDSDNYSYNFLKSAFMGTLIFCLKKDKNNIILAWDTDNDFTNQNLGSSKYPLFRFIYEYIVNQSIEYELLIETQKRFEKMEQFLKENEEFRTNLNTLNYFFIQNEEKLFSSIKYFNILLSKDQKGVPYSYYGQLANNLIAIQYAIADKKFDKEISECKEKMINNIDEISSEIHEKINYFNGNDFSNNDAKNSFNEFMKELNNKIDQKNKQVLYLSPENIINQFNDFKKSKNEFIIKRCFASKFDLKNFENILKLSTSEELNTIRLTFKTVYEIYNIKDIFSHDLNSLKEIKNIISKLLQDEKDKVKIFQLKYFEKDINNKIDKLEI